MDGLTYTTTDAVGARQHTDDVRNLYAAVYVEPPYNEGPEHVRPPLVVEPSPAARIYPRLRRRCRSSGRGGLWAHPAGRSVDRTGRGRATRALAGRRQSSHTGMDGRPRIPRPGCGPTTAVGTARCAARTIRSTGRKPTGASTTPVRADGLATVRADQTQNDPGHGRAGAAAIKRGPALAGEAHCPDASLPDNTYRPGGRGPRSRTIAAFNRAGSSTHLRAAFPSPRTCVRLARSCQHSMEVFDSA